MNAVTKYGYDLTFDSVYIVAIVSNALNVVFGVMNAFEGNERYGYMIGHNFALLVSRIFVLIDKATSMYLLNPVKPWIRFKK